MTVPPTSSPSTPPGAATTTTTGRLARHGAVMAAGSFVSRILGVVRQSMIMMVFGRSLAGEAWSVANQLPNMIYLLLAGGVLNAVLVPQITKARNDPDGGQVFIDRLLTVAIAGLAVVTLVCVPAAPLLVKLFASSSWGASQFGLSVMFAYIALPAIFFYGLYTILGQVLNADERFGWFMWSPVLCNVVWIVGLGWFLTRHGSNVGDPGAYTPGMIWLLAGSLTLGVALQALVLLVPLHRSGFRYRPRWGLRGVGLGSASRVASWTFALLAVSQLGLIVQSRVLTSAARGDTGKLPYDSAFLLFMTPHGLITVSLVTALFTTMSRAAVVGDLAAVRAGVRQGMTLSGIATIPIAFGTLALGTCLSGVIFLGNTRQTSDAIGYLAMAMMLGLPAFGIYYVIQRAFFAFEDGRTPFWLQVVNTGVAVAIAGVAMFVPSEYRALTVALGQAASNLVAAVVAVALLRRRLGGLDLFTTIRTYVRVTVASIPATILAYAVFIGAQALLPALAAFIASLVVGGLGFIVVYVALARRMHVAEVDELLRPVTSRLRGAARSGPRSA